METDTLPDGLRNESTHMFVGRQEALDAFYDCFAYRHTKNSIYYWGLGGTGKTEILWKIHSELLTDPYRKVTPIIDFFETKNQNVFGLQQSIRSRIELITGPVCFEPYEAVLHDLEKARTDPQAEMIGVISALEARRDQIFIDCCNRSISGYEIILLFDTFERVHQLDAGQWLLKRFMPSARDLVIAICGRPVMLGNEASPVAMPDNVRTYELRGFSRDDLSEFFDKTWGFTIPVNKQEKLREITDGNPLLIRLILDQVQNDTSALESFLQARPGKELRAKIASYYAEATPVNRLIWAMAYFNRRFTTEMLEFIIKNGDETLGLSSVDLDQLRRYPFVKKYEESESHLLHDEMQIIVRDLILKNILSSADLQKLYDLVVHRYYPAKIKKLSDTNIFLSKQLRAEQLAYLLDRMPRETIGLEKYSEYFSEVQSNHDYDFEEMLWGVVRDHYHRLAEQKFGLALRRTEFLLKQNLFGKAVAHLRLMAKDFPDQSHDFSYQLGFALMRTGEVQNAIEVLNLELSLLPTDSHSRLADIENTLGQAKLNTGRWDEALTHFGNAIQHHISAQNIVGAAGPYLNRAYIYAQKGMYADSIAESTRALLLLEKSGRNDFSSNRQRIYANMNMGTGYRHAGEYEKADHYYQISYKFSEDDQDQEGICYSLQQIGINNCLHARQLRRNHGDLSIAIKLLSRAWDSETQSLALAHKTNWLAPLGSGLSRLAKVYEEIDRVSSIQQTVPRTVQMDFNNLHEKAKKYEPQSEVELQYSLLMPGRFAEFNWLQKAARLFELSALIADEGNDFHRALDSLMEFSSLLIETQQYDLVPLVIKRTERLKGYDYQEALFAAMSDVALADVAFARSNLDLALSKYASAYAELSGQTGYATYILTDRLRDFDKRIRSLPPKTRHEWCDYLAKVWQERSVSVSRPDMIRLIEQVRMDAILG